MKWNIRNLLTLSRAVSPTPGYAAQPLVNSAGAAAHCVNLNDPTPAPPYTTWLTAARTIQDAINAAAAGYFSRS